MPRNVFLFAAALPALMLAGCGDDLESRGAAAEKAIADRAAAARDADAQDDVVEDDVVATPRAEAERPARARRPAADDDDGPTVVDASPEELMDTAQGFSPDPLDDASGIDPAPLRPEPIT
ncbi:hypothetical protein [Erythrobacter alti]|uniref:hypothetical protein n=1 Tax=Erythrobacter alti TaxID=1896145 RepID=UPI0030F4580F